MSPPSDPHDLSSHSDANRSGDSGEIAPLEHQSVSSHDLLPLGTDAAETSFEDLLSDAPIPVPNSLGIDISPSGSPEPPTQDFAADNDSQDLNLTGVPHQVQTAEAAAEKKPDIFSGIEEIGEYKVLRRIGSGGMGQVFLAEHKRMQRQVAIKLIRNDRVSDPSTIDRFYDEVRAASRVLHPNVVTAFDASEQTGLHYLVMEYVNGMTLTRLVSKKGPLSTGFAAELIRQAALGLLHAHRAGVVHRDVKPGNLIYASDGTLKVLDLGLAQISQVVWSDDGRDLGRMADPDSHYKRKGRLVGTLAYMSPEQLEHADEADPRSDIYSLGAVLYFLLTAKSPYSGDYLEQVYGHRHGEIPDLMRERSDVDLGLANVLRRMLAKDVKKRYASMDEVIEDIGKYAQSTSVPSWMAGVSGIQLASEQSTFSGGSTSLSLSTVCGIDLGMTYAALAKATPGYAAESLPAGQEQQPLYRIALADDGTGLYFDQDAYQLRYRAPKKVVHCLPMYIGKDIVQRSIAQRQCPPEALMGLSLHHMLKHRWPEEEMPQLTAVTVPASYDQFHRRSVRQACRLAGLESVRLVHRGIAAVQSLLQDADQGKEQDVVRLDKEASEILLFIGLTGQATEISLICREGTQMTELATAGHWHTGMLSWLSRLVDLATQAFLETHQLDPTESSLSASRLQMACEKALNSLLLLPETNVTLHLNQAEYSIVVSRQQWLERCHDLIAKMQQHVQSVCQQAGIRPEDIDSCVTLGPIMRMASLREDLLAGCADEMPVHMIDRSAVARGAAACLAAELPQRGDMQLPPKSVSGQSIGIVIEDNEGRRRILPIMPRGETLPARTNRKLNIAANRNSMTLSIVESSGIESDQWQSLGRYEFTKHQDESKREKRTRMIGFELNIDGLLTVRAQSPDTPESNRLPIIPKPMLPLEDEAAWTRWIASVSTN